MSSEAGIWTLISPPNCLDGTGLHSLGPRITAWSLHSGLNSVLSTHLPHPLPEFVSTSEDGRKSEWTPGIGDGQGGLVCCDSWGRKESDMTERLNWTELKVTLFGNRFCADQIELRIEARWGHTADDWIKTMWLYTYSGILLSHKKEWNNAICGNADGPRDYFTKWSKSEGERQLSYAVT